MKLSRRRIDDRSADALGSGRAVADEPELSAFVAEVQALRTAAPTPSAELAAMLEHGVPASVLDRTPFLLPAPARRAVSWRYAMISLAAAVTAVLGAGAANALPAPAQRAVADVIGWITPLHLPQPASDRHTPQVVPTSSPSATPTGEPGQSTQPAPSGTRSPGHGSGDGSSTGSGDGSGDGTDVRESPSSGSDGSGGDGGPSGQSPEPQTTSTPDGGSSDGGGSSPQPTSTPSESSGSGGGSSGDSGSGSSTPTPTPSS